jgi:GDP-L-fucose synthase
MKYSDILITGGNGLVGRALRSILPDVKFATHKDFDFTRESSVAGMYFALKPKMVIHAAARVGGIIAHQLHPLEFLEDNVLMNTLMIKYARLYKTERFLGLLSSCIFPDVMDVYPMKEEVIHDGAPTPANFTYGIAKRVLAVQIDACNKEFGTKYNYITPCNLYGEFDEMDESKSHYIPALIKKIYLANKNGDDHITLYGDGSPLRQIMYVKDLVKIIKTIVDRDITESFNVVPDVNVSINDIALTALRATNSEHLKLVYDTTKPNGQMRKDLDNSKLKRIIPDVQFTSLEDGLREYYKNFKL